MKLTVREFTEALASRSRSDKFKYNFRRDIATHLINIHLPVEDRKTASEYLPLYWDEDFNSKKKPEVKEFTEEEAREFDENYSVGNLNVKK
jgi:hypothetical protein